MWFGAVHAVLLHRFAIISPFSFVDRYILSMPKPIRCVTPRIGAGAQSGLHQQSGCRCRPEPLLSACSIYTAYLSKLYANATSSNATSSVGVGLRAIPVCPSAHRPCLSCGDPHRQCRDPATPTTLPCCGAHQHRGRGILQEGLAPPPCTEEVCAGGPIARTRRLGTSLRERGQPPQLAGFGATARASGGAGPTRTSTRMASRTLPRIRPPRLGLRGRRDLRDR